MLYSGEGCSRYPLVAGNIGKTISAFRIPPPFFPFPQFPHSPLPIPLSQEWNFFLSIGLISCKVLKVPN